MPKGSSGLSAVARRRFQGEGTAPGPLQIAEPARNNTRATTRRRNADDKDGIPLSKRLQKTHSLNPSTTSSHEATKSDGASSLSNSFAGLVGDNEAIDEPSKVEQVSPNRIKALVVKGRKILVTGTCWLWVKSGTVTVYGALLPASEAAYRFYAPSAYVVPPIEVLSDVAEIELTSLKEGLHAVAKLQGKNLWDPPLGADTTMRTFFVLGHHFTMNPNLVRPQELDFGAWQSTYSQISKAAADEVTGGNRHSRILISGKRSSGRSTFARFLINRLLSLRDELGFLKHPEGVAVIDLDPEFPEFSPPGTVALVRVKELLLGPAITHPYPSTKVVKMHYCEISRSRILGPELAAIAHVLIQIEQEHFDHRCPVVISVPAWVSTTQNQSVQAVWSGLKVTELVQMDSSSSSLEALASLDGVPVRRISSIPIDNGLSAFDDAELRMQSYFHASKPAGGRLEWSELPLPALASARKSLSLGQHDDALAAVLLLDPLVDKEDTVDALLGSIGAVVALSKDYFDRELRQHVERPQNGLPRLMPPGPWPLPPSQSECLGLAYVAEVQVDPLGLVVYTPIPEAVLQDANDRVLVIVHAGRRKSRWSGSEWMAREHEAMSM